MLRRAHIALTMRNRALRRSLTPAVAAAWAVALVVTLAACGRDSAKNIDVDGSSTVGPITEAVSEEFAKVNDARVSVGVSGTGGGFEKFCRGETDVNDASRVIKDVEKQACAARSIEYVEIKIGVDGLTVAVNPHNDFAQCLSFVQLKTMWDVGSTATSWKQIAPSFPDETLSLFGPGTDSGTFDFFTQTVNGKAKRSRADYTASEDDNVLVKGVEHETNALGYFGYAYFREAGDRLKAVAIDGGKGKGCVAPTDATINDNSYPLARPLYIYVKKSSLDRTRVRSFVRFYLEHGAGLVKEIGYIPLQDAEYRAGLDALGARGQ